MNNLADTNVIACIKAAHARCRAAATEALSNAIEAGRLLADAKEAAGHGAFLSWLKDNCPEITPRTAQVYMRLHANRDKLPADAQRASHLSVREATRILTEEKPEQKERRLIRELVAATTKIDLLNVGARARFPALQARIDVADIPELLGIIEEVRLIRNELAEAKLRGDRILGQLMQMEAA